MAKLCPSLWPHGLQQFRLLCPSLSPGVCSNSSPLSRWCHPVIMSSLVLFSPAPGPFLMSWVFTSGGQSIGASTSASVPPMIIQDRFPLWLIGLISLQSKEFSRIFSNTTELSEYIMGNARLDESWARIKIAERNINNLRYANKTTLMAGPSFP